MWTHWLRIWTSNKREMPGFAVGDDGQAVVEFMLTLPVLIFAIALALQMSMFAYAKIIASNAALEAARSAAVHEDPTAGVIRRSRKQAVENVVRVRCRELFPFTQQEDAVTVEVSPEAEGDVIEQAKYNAMPRRTSHTGGLQSKSPSPSAH